MSAAQDKAMQMLATALEMEEKGQEYYLKASQTTNNEMGREIWKLLADYEVQHMERIKEIYDSLKAGQGWREDLALFSVPTDLGQVFRRLAKNQKEHIRADTGDIEALGVGIDFESAAIKFYEDHSALAEDPLEKKFVDLMAEEERTHLNLLSDMKMYYTDPESWFMEKERAGLDGA